MEGKSITKISITNWVGKENKGVSLSFIEVLSSMKPDIDLVVDFLVNDSQFVPFGPQIDEYTELLDQCDVYLKDAKTELLTLPYSPFKRIKSWRERRKDSRLLADMEKLQPRVTEAEANLRDILMKIMERKDLVRSMAQECYSQLLSCIDYTNKGLSHSEPIVEELRSLVDLITVETSDLKSMVLYNTDIVKQNRFELRLHAQTPSWARNTNTPGGGGGKSRARTRLGRAHLIAIRDEVDKEDCNDDIDNHEILSRLVRLRKSREIAMERLSIALESKETFLNNLENCIESKNSLQGRVKKDDPNMNLDLTNVSSSSSSSSSSSKIVEDKTTTTTTSTLSLSNTNKQREEAFLNDDMILDKIWYSNNCHLVYLNAQQLVNRLDSYHQQVMKVSNNLQRLVEIRENMMNLNLNFDGININTGTGTPTDSAEASPTSATENGTEGESSRTSPVNNIGGSWMSPSNLLTRVRSSIGALGSPRESNTSGNGDADGDNSGSTKSFGSNATTATLSDEISAEGDEVVASPKSLEEVSSGSLEGQVQSRTPGAIEGFIKRVSQGISEASSNSPLGSLWSGMSGSGKNKDSFNKDKDGNASPNGSKSPTDDTTSDSDSNKVSKDDTVSTTSI
jgi:hypothetical protein